MSHNDLLTAAQAQRHDTPPARRARPRASAMIGASPTARGASPIACRPSPPNRRAARTLRRSEARCAALSRVVIGCARSAISGTAWLPSRLGPVGIADGGRDRAQRCAGRDRQDAMRRLKRSRAVVDKLAAGEKPDLRPQHRPRRRVDTRITAAEMNEFQARVRDRALGRSVRADRGSARIAGGAADRPHPRWPASRPRCGADRGDAEQARASGGAVGRLRGRKRPAPCSHALPPLIGAGKAARRQAGCRARRRCGARASSR